MTDRLAALVRNKTFTREDIVSRGREFLIYRVCDKLLLKRYLEPRSWKSHLKDSVKTLTACLGDYIPRTAVLENCQFRIEDRGNVYEADLVLQEEGNPLASGNLNRKAAYQLAEINQAAISRGIYLWDNFIFNHLTDKTGRVLLFDLGACSVGLEGTLDGYYSLAFPGEEFDKEKKLHMRGIVMFMTYQTLKEEGLESHYEDALGVRFSDKVHWELQDEDIFSYQEILLRYMKIRYRANNATIKDLLELKDDNVLNKAFFSVVVMQKYSKLLIDTAYEEYTNNNGQGAWVQASIPSQRAS